MNREQDNGARAPLPFLEAVAAHNLRVFADCLKTTSLDHVTVVAPGPDADGVPGQALVDCMTGADRRAPPGTWLPDVGGLVRPLQDDEDGSWRAGVPPPMRFAKAAETVAGDLLDIHWVRGTDAVDRAVLSGGGAVLGHSVAHTGLMDRRVVRVPETPQAELDEILDMPNGDLRAVMDEAAFRHNLAVAVAAMQEAGIDEVVLRSGSPVAARRLPVIEWHGEDGNDVEVSGIVSPQPLSGGGWRLVEFGYPMRLDLVLNSLAVAKLETMDAEWSWGSADIDVAVTSQGLHASVDRDVTQKVRSRAMAVPERAPDVAPAPSGAGEPLPGPDM